MTKRARRRHIKGNSKGIQGIQERAHKKREGYVVKREAICIVTGRRVLERKDIYRDGWMNNA